MLYFMHQLALYAHIIVGSLCLIIFWLPLIQKKGSKSHRFYGGLFITGMYVVSISGIIMTILVLSDPLEVRAIEQEFSAEHVQKLISQSRMTAGFLLMLSVLVFTNVRQSILVLKAKDNRNLLKSWDNLLVIATLGILGLVMGWIGIQQDVMLFKIFAALCVFISISSFHYIFKKNLKTREWILAHLGNIIGAGIGTYTAFFAFGGRRLFAEILTGNMQIIPWILPGVIGITASIILTRKYEKQYRVS